MKLILFATVLANSFVESSAFAISWQLLHKEQILHHPNENLMVTFDSWIMVFCNC